MITLSPHDIDALVSAAVSKLLAVHKEPIRMVYGIPRGGMPAAYKVGWEIERRRPEGPTVLVMPATAVSNPASAGPGDAILVDDIVDTGETMRRFSHKDLASLSLVVRDSTCGLPDFWGRDLKAENDWIRFPWDESSGTPEDAVVRILQYLGVDPNSPSLKETPRRFLSWLSEFRADQPEPEITTFSGIEYDQMILVRDIPFISLCEHHLMVFRGTAAVAYIPASEKKQVVGLSKLARIVTHRARRPQVQERLTEEILAAVKTATLSTHVGVVIKAEHTCMTLRGPLAQGSMTVTSALGGDFRNDAKTREEFLRLSSM